MTVSTLGVMSWHMPRVKVLGLQFQTASHRKPQSTVSPKGISIKSVNNLDGSETKTVDERKIWLINFRECGLLIDPAEKLGDG